jgi:predicted methyltransferase
VSGGPRDAVEALRAEWRLDFRAAERVLGALGAGGSIAEIVTRTAVDRHEVEEVLRRVEPWVRRDDERYVLAAEVGAAAGAGPGTAAGAGVGAAAGEPAGAAGLDERTLVAAMTEVAAGLPPPATELDHVSALPATMAARACYFAERYALAGSTVLCVGDHDLTSVAIALVEPAADVLVVDVDQRILGYLGRVAAERELPITTAFADLRVGLPPSFAERADLVFTDPPYTPDGVALFLARGLQGLRRSGHERIAFAYGFAGRQLARGFRTQSTVHELRLVTEALLPGFNRFDGAEAIGAASDLYVCRPTRWTWPALDRAPASDPRIYTRGPAAAESGSAQLAESIVEQARTALGDAAAGGIGYVGAGWPTGPEQPSIDLAGFLTGGRSRRQPVAVNLHPHFGALLPQTLLAAAQLERALVVAPAAAVHATADGPVWTLLRASEIEVRGGAEASLVVLRRRPEEPAAPVDQVYAFLTGHPEAKVGNAWRDALVALAQQHGEPLTKNQARALIRSAGLPERALRLRLAELPAELLDALVAAVARTVPATIS